MATSNPTPSKPSTSTPTTQPSRDDLFHYLSIGAVVACPILIALPPRKLDIYTLGLLSTTLIGANQLSTTYTGVSIVQRTQARFTRFGDKIKETTGDNLPPKALEVQKRLRAEKAERERREEVRRRVEVQTPSMGDVDSSVLRELERKEQAKIAEEGGGGGGSRKGMFERVWLGGEGEDWKQKRDEREKAALEEGRGYGGLIMDQIWEVWNWGEKKMENVKEEDERVVEERRKEVKK